MEAFVLLVGMICLLILVVFFTYEIRTHRKATREWLEYIRKTGGPPHAW